jgi:hypothetical protein
MQQRLAAAIIAGRVLQLPLVSRAMPVLFSLLQGKTSGRFLGLWP